MKLLDRLFDLEKMDGDGLCDVYMLRWCLLRLKNFQIYVHHFVGDDWTRDLHDHPKRFVSIGLWGAYVEETPQGERVYRAPWIRTFPATHIHRLRLLNNKRTCWTVVVVTKPVRAWGFWNNGKWYPWEPYVESDLARERKSC